MRKFLFYTGIGLISLTPLLWFKNDLIIAHGDDALFLNPGAVFNNVKWSWDNFFYNCGGANNSFPLVFPLSLFWFFLTKLGFGLAVIERCWLAGVWFITGCSMAYLARVLGLGLRASFFSVLLYLLNIFTAQQPLVYNFRLPYMVQPFLLAFTIRGLNSNTALNRYIILFGLATVLAVSSWTNTPWALFMFFPVFFYISYRFLMGNRLRIIYFVIGISLITLVLNLWWLIPYSASIIATAGHIGELNINIFAGKGFYEIFRFLRSWAFNSSGFDFHKLYYNSWIVILTTYLIPSIVFSSLFRRDKGFKDYYFFVFLALIAMFLTKGPVPPFGQVYDYLFRNLPGFVIFREPYTKFMPLVILLFSVLFGDSVNRLCKRHVFSIAVFIVVIIPAFPMFTKDIMWRRQNGWNENRGARSAYVKVPGYWHTAKDWFKGDSRLFTLPRPTGVYNWDSGLNCVDTVARYFLKGSVISCSGNYNTAVQFLNFTYDAFIKNNMPLHKMLKIFGVRYILHDKDIYTNTHWRFHGTNYLPPLAMKKRLQKLNEMELVKTIGHLDFYKLKNEYCLPKIYAANNLTYVDGSLPDLVLEPLESIYSDKPAIFLDKQNQVNNLVIVKRKGKNNRYLINVLESGNYDVFLGLVPNLTDIATAGGSTIDIDLIDLLSNGEYYLNSIPSYDYKTYPYEIALTMPFDGGPEEDEYLQIKDKDINIDLMQYPNMRLCYRVEDPAVQILQLVLGVDTDGDNEVNIWMRDIFERPASAKYSFFYYDVLNKIRQIYKHNKYYNVIKIEVYPHKLWGIDCSERPKDYHFYLKKLEFFNKLDYKKELVIKDKIFDKYLSDELAVDTDSLDLLKYNQIEFQWMGLPKNAMIDVKLELDLNSDGLSDREEVVYSFNASTKQISHLIDFQNVIPMGHEGISNVKLMSIHWDSQDLKPMYIKDRLRRVIVYKHSNEKEFKDYAFSVDGKKYIAEAVYKGKNVVINYKDIPLSKGKKVVKNLLAENDPFNFEWICFKKSKISNITVPEIKSQELNPTKYIVHVTDAQGPFLLVFSESFHKAWKAYILPDKEEIKEHIQVNGYAQGWQVTGPSGNFQILIKYLPQDWTNIGWLVSGLALAGCLIYLWRRF